MAPVDDSPSSWPCHHLTVEDGIDAHMWLVATVNSSTWLHQAANGEVPHGGITWNPSASNAENPSPPGMMSWNAMTTPSGTSTATTMPITPAPEPPIQKETPVDTEPPITFDDIDMMPLEDGNG